ncbi:MAG: tetratricopeptide repeat protein [Myxococcaceae bacterium]
MAKNTSRKTAKPKRPKAHRPAPLRPAPVRQATAVREVDPARQGGRAFPIEIDPRKVEESLAKLKGELVAWANKGRYTKVRFKFRGKQLLPDLPLAAVAAAEGLTFYWGGILRALIFNLAGKTVFDVELVNDSEKRIARGKEELLSGEVDKALECFREALAMDRDNPRVHLNLGVALKLKGDFAGARVALEQAKELDPEGPVGAEAERLLSGMRPPPPTGQALATRGP